MKDMPQDGVKICGFALAYDNLRTHKTWILNSPQSLNIPGLPTHLLNPNHMRHLGVIVNEVPLVMLPEVQRTDKAHSIIINTENDRIHIPLTLQGTMLRFNVRRPPMEEMLDREGTTCTHV
jgi:hypothetical protein